MIHISTVFLPFLIFVVLNLAQLPSFAKRAGGGGGGFRSSSGGSFGRSSGSSFGRSSSSGFGRSSSFGGGARSSPGVRTIGSSSPSASRSSWGSSSSSGTRFGGATGSGRIGGGSPGVSGGSGGSRFGSSNSAGAKAASPGRIGTSLAAGGLGGAAAGSAVRYGSGSYSGLGSSAGKVGAGNSGGIYSSGSGTRWGSSAASGSGGGAMAGIRNRFAGTGNAGGIRTPSAGNARPNYGSSFGSGGRPRVSAPAAATAQRVTVNYSPQYTTYNTRYGSRLGGLGGVGGYGGSGLLGGRRGYSTGSLIATGAAAGIGGYYLGRMMGRLHSPWGYGGMYGGYGYGGYPYGYGGYGGYVMPGCVYGCSPYAAYVPYRDRYSEYYSHQDSVVSSQNTVNNYNNNNGNNDVNNQGQGGAGGQISGQTGGQTATATESPSAKNVDLCTLARWNRELPFAELPNMALDFLANNNISGNSTSDKAKFLFEFFTVSVDAYEQYNSSADIFTIPSTYDVKACNIQVSKSAVVNSANAVQSEEPILTSLRHMLNLYSNKSSDSDSLRDVVTAAKLCVPQGPNITNPEILPCLDFSITPEQLLKLEDPRSMFGSAEICRRQLSPDMFKCMPKSTPSGCQMQHLQTINLFARNFYLCSEAVDDKTPSESGAGLSRLNGADAFKAAFTPPTTKSNVIHYSGTGWDGTTTAKPGFWSRIFG